MRAPSAPELATLIPKVMNCFKAAALATGTTFTTHRQQVYLDLQPIQGLADEFKRYAEERWAEEGYKVTETPRSSASTDFVSGGESEKGEMYGFQRGPRDSELTVGTRRATSLTLFLPCTRCFGFLKPVLTNFLVSDTSLATQCFTLRLNGPPRRQNDLT